MEKEKIYKMLVDYEESAVSPSLDIEYLYGFKDKKVKVGDTITVDLCMWDDRKTLIEMKVENVVEHKKERIVSGTYKYLEY